MAQPQEIEHIWITMSDGCRLAAKIWVPAEAHQSPVPAILEYIPYRKRDLQAERDAQTYRFFARHGYAGVRVDLRGSGDSEGVLQDEYLQQELDDGLEVLSWIAAQSWCNGKVGMMGLSWGGFNSLQIAALQPPELGAIITVCSSDDRYRDDVHYMGGCLLTDNLSWASTMFAYNSCPPDPALVGDQWREMWLDRLEGSGLWLRKWLDHQRRDDYWKHASVCEDFSAIRCPVFAISGWADGYSNTVFRLLENLQIPRKGLIGAWGHKYPHLGDSLHTIDFLGQAVRWWDHWLKGVDNGVDQDPMLTAWMLDEAADLDIRDRPGHWVVEEQWPSSRIEPTEFFLSENKLHRQNPGQTEALDLQSPLSVGLFAGKWCSYSEASDLPDDQRKEDGGALVFDTPPVEEDLEMIGAPVVELTVSVDQPQAMIAARLSDIGHDGQVIRVTYGLLNLAHRHSHENPEPLEPGKRYHVRCKLNRVAQRFRSGNRIRLALSTSYWPLAFPSPHPTKITIYPEDSRIVLPVRKAPADERPVNLGSPTKGKGLEKTILAPASREWKVIHDLSTNEVEQHIINNDPRYRLEHIDLEVQKDVSEHYSYVNNIYSTVRGEVNSLRRFKRARWEARSKTQTILTATPSHFHIRATLDAYEGDARIFSKSWDEKIKRDMI